MVTPQERSLALLYIVSWHTSDPRLPRGVPFPAQKLPLALPRGKAWGCPGSRAGCRSCPSQNAPCSRGCFCFLSLDCLTNDWLSLPSYSGTGGLWLILSEQPAKEASVGMAQMASPNDKVNYNMSWRHCQAAAYLSCHGSLLGWGVPVPPLRSWFEKLFTVGLLCGCRRNWREARNAVVSVLMLWGLFLGVFSC